MRKLILVAALLALAAPAHAQRAAPAPHSNPAPRSSAQQPAVSSATKKFVNDAAITDIFEIQAGQLAQQKVKDAAYKDFAQMTISDHTKTTEELKGMAPKLGIELPQKLDQKHQALLDKLNTLSGAAFESAYRRDQIEGHQAAIAMFQRYARSGDNPEVKRFASQTLPTLHKHEQHAQSLPRPGQAPTVGSAPRR